MLDIQRRFSYKVDLVWPDGYGSTIEVDELTPPETTNEVVSRQNKKMGQIKLKGPASYGDATMRVAIRIGEGAQVNQVLIERLLASQYLDDDTVSVYLTMLSSVSLSADGLTGTFEQAWTDCKISSVKLDGISRKDDGEFLHLEIVLSPQKISDPKHLY